MFVEGDCILTDRIFHYFGKLKFFQDSMDSLLLAFTILSHYYKTAKPPFNDKTFNLMTEMVVIIVEIYLSEKRTFFPSLSFCDVLKKVKKKIKENITNKKEK